MKPKWYKFDTAKGSRQKRPPIYRLVLVIRPGGENYPPEVNVGYRKDAAGDKQCPYFVTPGQPGQYKTEQAIYWSDCLGDDFKLPDDIWNGMGNTK